MNVSEQARLAYSPAHQPIQTDRSIESNILGQITYKLSDAANSTDFPSFVKSLYQNRQFWTTVAADVADQGNQLPEALRAQIFYLAEFTEIQSKKILAGEGNADILIEINKSVLQGLDGRETIS